MSDLESKLIRRIRAWTLLFIIGLVVSGATAIPLETELNWLVRWSGAEQFADASRSAPAPGWADWLLRVCDALREVNTKFPFLSYGTDWLAFGHFVIAVAFVGLLRDPVRNRWLIDFGLIACAMVIPYALVMGGIRGIPFGWRLIDCSFGLFGVIPLWWCRRMVDKLEGLAAAG